MFHVTDLDRPHRTPARVRLPSWRDKRLLTGLALVLAATALSLSLLSRADQTHPYYSVAGYVAPGSVVAPGDLVVVRARLQPDQAQYVRAGQLPQLPQIAQRAIGPGELIPADALVPSQRWQQRIVSLPQPSGLVPSLAPGQLADVWVSPAQKRLGGVTYGRAQLLIASVEVQSVNGSERGLGAASLVTVHVVVETGQVAALLDALAAGSRITLLPLPATGVAP